MISTAGMVQGALANQGESPMPQEIVSIDLTSGAIGLVLGVLLRSLLTHVLGLDQDRRRDRLARETAREQLVYGSLHAKRADAILEIWRSLREARNALGAFVFAFQPGTMEEMEQRGLGARASIARAREAVRQHAIFFTPETATVLETMTSTMSGIHYTCFDAFLLARLRNEDPRTSRENRQEFRASWKKIKTDLDPLLGRMEEEFRALVGVTSNSTRSGVVRRIWRHWVQIADEENRGTSGS